MDHCVRNSEGSINHNLPPGNHSIYRQTTTMTTALQHNTPATFSGRIKMCYKIAVYFSDLVEERLIVVTCGAGTAYPSGSPVFTRGF